MEFNKNNSVTLTQKRIASAKGLHLICAIVAMVLNIIAFTVLAVNVTASEIMFLVFPAVLAVLDVLFLVKVISTKHTTLNKGFANLYVQLQGSSFSLEFQAT